MDDDRFFFPFSLLRLNVDKWLEFDVYIYSFIIFWPNTMYAVIKINVIASLFNAQYKDLGVLEILLNHLFRMIE